MTGGQKNHHAWELWQQMLGSHDKGKEVEATVLKRVEKEFTEAYSGKHMVQMLFQEISGLNANTVAGCTARRELGPT